MNEKRKWPRLASLEPCAVSSFTVGSSTPLASRIINFSYTGLLLESDTPLRRGESISIQLTSCPQEKDLSALTLRTGKVRWCSRQSNSLTGNYHIGVEMTGGLHNRN